MSHVTCRSLVSSCVCMASSRWSNGSIRSSGYLQHRCRSITVTCHDAGSDKTTVNQFGGTVRFNSSSAKDKADSKAKNLQYLESWIGKGGDTSSSSVASTKITTNPSHTAPVTSPNNHRINSSSNSHNNPVPVTPLTVTGSSYLLPTLRLDRGDTPSSLARQVDSALSFTTNLPTSTMITGKLVSSSSSQSKREKKQRWAVPLILDLGAFHPDGSPHYVAPTKAKLQGFIQVLREQGIQVMGISNAPVSDHHFNNHNNTNNTTTSLEEIVSSLGLPPVMSMRSSTTGNNNMSMTIDSVIQLVRAKDQAEKHTSDDNTEEETEASSPVINNIQEDTATAVASVTAATTTTPVQEQHQETAARITPAVTAATTTSAAPPSTSSSKVYHGNVRTGQQVSADRGRSLVVLGSVHSGGEVMADGDIFVYGKLQGRALAGLAGDARSKIFASRFDPELVCIGGTFRTVDDVTDLGLDGRRTSAAMVEVVAADNDDSDDVLTFREIPL